MALRFDINIDEITKNFQEFKKEIENDIMNATAVLAKMVRTGISERVEAELKSTRKLYMDNLSEPVEVEPGVWVITLNKEAVFLEDGGKAGPMTGLLNSPKAKEGKNGKYIAIPIGFSGAPSTMTPSTQQVSLAIRAELKKRKIGYTKIEFDEKGAPKLGMLHKFTTEGEKIKPHHKHSPMEGVTVSQRMGENGQVERSVQIFRTMTAENIWQHPGTAPHNFFEDALEEGIKKWNAELSEILNSYQGSKNK